ncbi:hypothetical protein GPALN_004497 [Globodera pallida]|nr:hypothetical protein GPALN_004497 [Globodera pallida]
MLFTVRNLPFVFMLVSITSLLLNAHAAQIADENGPPSSPVASSAEGNTLLAALKRVFMSTPPAELFKNLSRITFYRHVPPQTQVINLPIGTDEDSSSFPNIAPTASTLNFTTAAAQMMFHSFLPNQNAQFSPICSQPQQVGNGPYRIPRWFFNTGQSRCELFYWSGCCGNANNFQSMDQCERTCRGIHSQSASSTSQFALSSSKPQNSSPPNTLVYVPVSLTLSIPHSAAHVQQQQLRPQFRRVQAAASSSRSASLALTSADEELSPPEFPVRDADVEQQNDQTTTASGAAMRPMNGTHPSSPEDGHGKQIFCVWR